MRRQCRETGEVFETTEKDLEFYERIAPRFAGVTYAIPPPTLAPQARRRRHLTFRNERTLYRRACDATDKTIVSIYAPGAAFPVFEHRFWFSDHWDALEYGRPFDFSRPFFEQFAELSQLVPRPSLLHRFGNESSPYTNLVSENRNCHYVFAASKNEDCFYSTYIQRCRDVGDSFFIFDCELCYECIDCHECYRVRYSQECSSCSSSEYLLGCVGCIDCFGCVSLVNKRFCLFNQQLDEYAYHRAISQIQVMPDSAEYVERKRGELVGSVPRKFYTGMQNQDSTGDHLVRCKNVENCYDCTGLEECKNCTWLHQSKDCYDCYAWGLPGELGLENHLVGNGFYRVIFSNDCSDGVSNLSYCQTCYLGCKDLFGCIGLRKQQYCVLNQQYSPGDYERLVPRIIEHMRRTGEWGEYFPQSLSPFGYNETVAQEYFPLSEQDVRKQGWNWRCESLPGIYGNETAMSKVLETAIEQVDESVCEQTFACEISGRNFRFTRPELTLYKKLAVPLPRQCFEERHRRRFERRNPRVLYPRICGVCGVTVQSSFAPTRQERICCESCFLAANYG